VLVFVILTSAPIEQLRPEAHLQSRKWQLIGMSRYVIRRRTMRSSIVRGVEPSEYCELEQFRPVCPDDKVIVITEARYGLVSLGRCLQADFGYVGCFADVRDYVAGKCTGRRTCQQQVPDRFMKEAAARCRPEFSGFLYAAYECIDGKYASHCYHYVQVKQEI